MAWSIRFYQAPNGHIPGWEFLAGLDKKMLEKALYLMDLLEQRGADLNRPYAKTIWRNPYKGIRKLQIKQGSHHARLFFTINKDHVVVILSGFIKKTRTTPDHEMERATKYRIDSESRPDRLVQRDLKELEQ